MFEKGVKVREGEVVAVNGLEDAAKKKRKRKRESLRVNRKI